MSRRQLPPQIKKIEVVDRTTGKTVVRYQLTADAGVNHDAGKRQQVPGGMPPRSRRVMHWPRSPNRQPLTLASRVRP
jgi:hypothetical protein